MYSYEERKKAIKLYIKYNKFASAVIRELGYPTHKMLKTWYLEYKERGDVHKQFRLRYTDEQRASAIAYYLEHGKSLSRTVRAMGYPFRALLGEWVRADLPFDYHPLKGGRSVVQYTDEQKIEEVVSIAFGEKKPKDVEAEIGVTRSAISQWKRQLLGDGEQATMGKNKPRSTGDQQPESESNLREQCETLKAEWDKLQRQVHHLQMEKDIIEKAASVLKKREGIDIEKLSNREKAMVVDALASSYPVQQLLTAVHMAKSSFFYQRSAMKRDKYAEVRDHLHTAYKKGRGCYGYRRLHIVLTAGGEILSQKVVLRFIHEEQLALFLPKRKKYSSYMGEIGAEVGNLLKRDSHADNPNEKWLSDITEFSIPAGKIYLSPIVDCFDGMVPSWTRDTSPDAKLVNSMLDEAILTLEDGKHPILHTDRGGHYRWPGWIERIGNSQLVRSMSRKGCSPDNSACEGFFGRLKNEMFYNRSWKGVSIEEFCAELDDYITWYNEE